MQFFQTWMNRFYHFQNFLKSIFQSPFSILPAPISPLRKLRWASLFPVSFLLFSLIYSQDILGDVNQDGTIDILDILRTVNIVLNVPPEPTDYENWAADVNADSIINIQDILLMVEIILESEENIGEWVNISPFDFEEENYTLSGSFINDHQGWFIQIGNNKNILYYTANMGESWEEILPIFNFEFKDLSFYSIHDK